MSLDSSQIQFIAEIKEKVRTAQYEALKAVNIQLLFPLKNWTSYAAI